MVVDNLGAAGASCTDAPDSYGRRVEAVPRRPVATIIQMAR